MSWARLLPLFSMRVSRLLTAWLAVAAFNTVWTGATFSPPISRFSCFCLSLASAFSSFFWSTCRELSLCFSQMLDTSSVLSSNSAAIAFSCTGALSTFAGVVLLASLLPSLWLFPTSPFMT
uniref:Uncharacterized protein n=1 Tax=Ixodes ricinus TaxID=34613 RepID=A0A6B0UNL6_IXORI